MEFRLLGPVGAVDGGRPLALGGRRQRAVLTHLLLHRGTALSRDVLVELVWGEDPPRAVAASLHTYVSRLRSALGPTRLETRSAGYVLHAEPEEVDAVRFEAHLARARASATEDPAEAVEHYTRALQLWRGPALGDLADELSLAPDAARLDGLHDRAVEERIALRLACGEHAALVPELTALVERWPLREDLWGHLVLALYRSGRQAEALAACEAVRLRLDDELGVAPGPALRRLQTQVLRQDPALAPAVDVLHGYVLREQVGRGPTCVVHRAVQPVVGREVALKLLHRSVSDAPELVQRFSAAASAAAAVEHPHVLPLYDCWRDPGGAVLVLRLLHGGTLGGLVRTGRCSVGELLHLLEQVAAAVDACWRQGVVHRHLEPDDVLLDAHGHAYVSSFVLARDLTRGGGTDGAGGRPDVSALARLLHDVLPGPAVAPDGHDGLSLVAAVRAAVAPAIPGQRSAPPPEGPRNPYKGLRAFSEADAGDFAGRTELVTRLVHRLTDDGLRFVAVVGPSGSGKSSVVRAGVVPALRAGSARWYVVEVVPGATPFTALETALRRVAVQPLPPGTADELRTAPATLPVVVDEVLPKDDRRSRVLLVVDQFEELFALVDPDERSAFLDVLATAADARDGRLRVVVTLRADFYDRPLTHPVLAGLVQAGTEVVVPLTAEELEQAVVEPAERAGLRVEPALLAQVVADVGHAPGALPLLQFALTELAEAADDGVLTLSAYRDVGGVAGALLQRADGLHERSTEHERRIARQVLLQLVDPSDAGADLRRRVLHDELVRRTDDPETAADVITAYGAARLLAFDRDPATRAPTVEVAHEALLQQWSVLRGWIDAARDDLRAAQRLAAAAREWDETGRDPSFLASGARLSALEQRSARSSSVAGPLERAYLAASSRARDDLEEQEQARARAARAAQRREVRRLQATASVLAVAVAAATVLAVFGLAQQDRAERESVVSHARALAAASVASLDEDPERSVLLALRAVEATQDADGSVLPDAVEALHRAVVASRVVLTVPGVGGAADWSAGGLLVTAGPEGSGVVDLRRAADGEPALAWRGHDVDLNDVAFSPDGRRLLTTGDDGAARMWDVGTGRQVWEVESSGEVRGPSFDRAGRVVAAAWQTEGVVRVLDAASGALRALVRGVPRPEATAVTPDGTAVLVAGARTPGVLVADTADGAALRHLDRDGPGSLDVAVSPDGRQVAAARTDGRTSLWDLADGRLRRTLHGSAPVADLEWSPDSTRILVGSEDDGVAQVFSLDDEAPREVLRLPSSELRGVSGVAFSPDGERVLLGDGRTTRSQVWDVSTAGSREWLTVAAPARRTVGADFASDGATVLASAPGGAVAVVDVRSGRRLRTTPASAGAVAGVRSAPDGRLVAGVARGALRVWDVGTAAQVLAVPVVAGRSPPAWRGDGARVALVTDDERLLLVDVPGGSVEVADLADVVAAAWTPDGRQVVTSHRTASGGRVSTRVDVHDLPTWDLAARWQADVTALVVTADGEHVVGAQPDGDVVVRRLSTGVVTTTLVGHVGRVLDLAPSPDGATLATAGEDGSVRLWDLDTGAQSLQLRGHDSAVSTVRWSGDGARLVTASRDGTVRVWAVELDDLVRLARTRVTRQLSADECRRYLVQERCS